MKTELKYLLYSGLYDDCELVGIYDTFEQCVNEICSLNKPIKQEVRRDFYKPTCKEKMLKVGLNGVYFVEGFELFHFDTFYTNVSIKEYFDNYL